MIRPLLTLVLLFAMLIAKAQLTDTVYVQVDGARLHAVLSKPVGVAHPPLALIIAGSGPTDLNGNQTMMQNNSLCYLSDALLANNIATLRFDKRGIAKSSYAAFKEADLTIDRYAKDVKDLIAYTQRRGFKDIYVIGHSEGALLGLIALQEIQVKGFVSLCGAGNSADVILKKQLKPKLPTAIYDEVEGKIDSLKNKQLVNTVPPYLYSLFRPSVQPYLISWFKYKPSELIRQCPGAKLIIQAEKDLQIEMEEARLLQSAANEAELVVIKQMNHVLKTISGDMQANVAAYTNPNLPVNTELVNCIVEFIK